MKLNTVEKVYLALRDGTPEIILPEPLRTSAERALRRMLSLG
jgi:quinolinate synthase